MMRGTLLAAAIAMAVTSCSWSPVFQRNLVLPAAGPPCEVLAADTDRLRTSLARIMDDVAERNGLEPCPSLIDRKREVHRVCTPWAGVHYTLSLTARQTNGTFRIELEEPDHGAFFRASESERARIIWNDLIRRLQEEFPDCVRVTE